MGKSFSIKVFSLSNLLYHHQTGKLWVRSPAGLYRKTALSSQHLACALSTLRLKCQHFPYTVSRKVRATACLLKSHAPHTSQNVIGFLNLYNGVLVVVTHEIIQTQFKKNFFFLIMFWRVMGLFLRSCRTRRCLSWKLCNALAMTGEKTFVHLH